MPQSLVEATLGRLEWDEGMGWWVGEVELKPGLSIAIFIDHDMEGGDVPAELAEARRRLDEVRRREAEYKLWTGNQLLDNRWNDDEPMGAEDIANLLEVASLLFRADGSVTIYWEDNNILFAGHNVVTELDAACECIGAGME